MRGAAGKKVLVFEVMDGAEDLHLSLQRFGKSLNDDSSSKTISFKSGSDNAVLQ